MRYSRTARNPAAKPVWVQRRQLIGALGAGALGAWLGGCAAPPMLPPRPVDRGLAPRVGDTWLYEYTSSFRSPPPGMLEVRLLEVGEVGLRDRMTFQGTPAGEERLFTSAVEMVERPLPGQTFFEFSPYLQDFGALPAAAAVATPLPNWGSPFTGRARLHGSERVAVPAGNFDAVRMDIDVSRTPGGTLQPFIDPVFTLATVWYAPAAKRAVQWKLVTRAGQRNILVDDTYRLASYRPA